MWATISDGQNGKIISLKILGFLLGLWKTHYIQSENSEIMRLPVERAAKTVSVMKVWESSSNISNKYPYSTFRTFMGPWILPCCDPPYLGSWTPWDKVLYTRRCRIERATFLCYCTICWIYLSRVMEHIILTCTCIFSLFWHNVPLNSAQWDEIPQNNTDSDAPRLG